MAVLLKPGEPPILLTPADGRVFTLAELQALVGGYIEAVRARFCFEEDHEPLYLVVNEDGKRLNLPRNGFATALYHATGGLRDDVIVGTAILASRFELNGDEPTE